LSWARFPRYFGHYVGLRIKGWFRRGNVLPLARRPVVGLPRCQRDTDARVASTPTVAPGDLIPQTSDRDPSEYVAA